MVKHINKITKARFGKIAIPENPIFLFNAKTSHTMKKRAISSPPYSNMGVIISIYSDSGVKTWIMLFCGGGHRK